MKIYKNGKERDLTPIEEDLVKEAIANGCISIELDGAYIWLLHQKMFGTDDEPEE